MERSNLLEHSERRAALFGALADPARVAILDELAKAPRCACDLGALLGAGSSLLAYHLRLLREAGLVRSVREGRRTRYSLSPAGLRRLDGELEAWRPAPVANGIGGRKR